MAGADTAPGPTLGLLLPGSSPVHRMDPAFKVAATVLFVCGVAFTPRRAVPAFLIDAAVVVPLLAVVGYRPRRLVARATVVAPFLALAAVLPFVATGPPIELDPLPGTVTAEGLWAAWNTGAKTLIGFGASLVLAGSTSVPALIRGLDRLRVPAPVVGVISFMFRYLDLLADELGRMRTAMTARGHDPRWLWQARPLASAAGALFVRSYERGERVHAAMLARGFDGRMPHPIPSPAPTTGGRSGPGPAVAFAPPVISVTGAVIGLIMFGGS